MNFYSILRIITGVIGAVFVILVFLSHAEGDQVFDLGIFRILRNLPNWFMYTVLAGMPIFYFLFEWANEENVRVAVKATFEFFGAILAIVIVGTIFFIVMDWLRRVY